METANLKQKLGQLDGCSYKAYREISGSYLFPRFTLFIDYVQADPFAAPSRLRARVDQALAGFDQPLYHSRFRRVALQDYLIRVFNREIGHHVKGHRGTGKSGLVAVDAGGQEILERSAAIVNDRFVEVRFAAGLPASGRRCLGKEAAAMLLEEIPKVVDGSLYFQAIDPDALAVHIASAEDQECLRGWLPGKGLAAFVADGALLPRQSGVSDAPLRHEHVVRFSAPADLRVEAELPNRRRVTGMGIPEGVTLIAGGGYHGKSTLLKALERSVYNHVPGDGRDLVVTRGDAVKIRSEDGRRVEKVNISPFISNLPFGVSTELFSTENASGSTSQAANIVEALEMGARLLLIDEDTSATNFMIRDGLMQMLISKDKEPITPFIDQVANLYKEHGVSTILVMGGSGDYFEVADTVIAMESYRARVVTAQARQIAAGRCDARAGESGGRFGSISGRMPLPAGINSRRGRKEKVSARGRAHLVFGRQTVDLSQVEQLVDASQTQAIGDMVAYGLQKGYFDDEANLAKTVEHIFSDVEAGGLDVVAPFRGCDHALPRPYEVAAMLNRLRTFAIKAP